MISQSHQVYFYIARSFVSLHSAVAANNWWERDPNINNSNNFMNVNTSGNANNNNNANNTNGVCLGFCNNFRQKIWPDRVIK